MEKLELKHLAGYLPYGLKVQRFDGIISNITESIYNLPNALLINFKPILRPLSDLTKEIEVNGEKFLPLDYISTSIKDSQQNAKYLFKGFYYNLSHWKIERLLELHFDIYGLIKKGLAIDINKI